LLPSSLYFHIPFCRHLCGYCAFAKTDQGAFSEEVQQNYLLALEREWHYRSALIDADSIKTIYIGGGTPSRLTPKNLERLLNLISSHFPLGSLLEKTFELNPEDLIERPELLSQLTQYGIDRVSMGLQTFQTKGLNVLERQSTEHSNLKALDLLFEHFKGKISLDFILTWPTQTMLDLEADLNLLSNYPAGHLSTYLLNYEPGTRLERDRKKGKIAPLDDDLAADIWEHFQLYCQEHGYEHYEISSFCKPHQAGQHNISTWLGQPYLGLGAGAVSRVDQQRWTNHKNLDLYIKHSQSNPSYETELITPEIAWQEDLLLSLRYNGGLNLSRFKHCHGMDLKKLLADELNAGCDNGLWNIKEDHLIMTPKAWQLFDHYISNWMLKLETILSAH